MVLGSPKILTVSDVHLFHGRVRNETILYVLRTILGREKPDIIIIAGDLFDRATQLSNQMVGEVETFFEELLLLCEREDIVLLLLEGTPSHDDRQARLLQRIYARMKLTFDFQYHDTVTVGRVEKYDLDVLFVPDEWKHDPNDTWKDVKNALKLKGLSKVALAVMHGTFRYQMPPMLHPSCHIEDRYLKIVTHYIYIGHHHRRTHYDRIQVPSSTVPLEHGTGDQHGYLMSQIFEDPKRDTIKFINVISPEPFIDHDIEAMTDDEFDALLLTLGKIKTRQHHRFLFTERDVRVAQLTQLVKEIAELSGTFKKIASASEPEAIEDTEDWECKVLPLTPNELPDLLISRSTWTEGEEDVARALLAELY